ncbi:MAG: hypothetical protein IPM99_03610 [Rubrivivax sp.]|nr:hypothetical protein [Rubrivivax sp.]
MDLSGPWPLWWLDLALAVMAAEALWLSWRGRRHAPARLAPRDWLWCLLSGLALLLAMRAALAGAALPVVGACLAAGGLCHLMDLRGRLARADLTRS